MIEKLNYKNLYDVFEYLGRVEDNYFDFYITLDKKRIFLRNNLYIINKILKTQEVYGLFDNELNGLLLIYREKGYRPYIKILSKNKDSFLIKFLNWNFKDKDLYCKLKKENELCSLLRKCGFMKIGDRGKEVLLFRKGIKILDKIIPKDNQGENNDQYNK